MSIAQQQHIKAIDQRLKDAEAKIAALEKQLLVLEEKRKPGRPPNDRTRTAEPG